MASKIALFQRLMPYWKEELQEYQHQQSAGENPGESAASRSPKTLGADPEPLQ
jgi:hypothetical protein